MSYDALDDFAGPGGWDEGARMIGLTTLGIEWDAAACETAKAAGHARRQGDVSLVPNSSVDWVTGRGYIASPPCQAWSMAGNRKGELDRANCHVLADRMACGDDSLEWTTWEDERSALVCQPVRRVRDLRPAWIALEEVPAVLGLWEHFARIFRVWGYSTWVGILCSADYGVPQTRERAILMARLGTPVSPPEPTHSREGGADLFGGHLKPWVSMSDALPWSPSDVIRPARGAGMIERHGERPDHPASEPAPTIISKSRSWIRGNQLASTTGRYYQRRVTEPAPTLTGVVRSWDWTDGSDAPKGTGVKVDIAEASVLQSFPADYPWSGGRSKQFEQVGNAVPPLLAAHVLSALTGKVLEVAA